MPKIQKTTACNRDCPDACRIVATLEDGVITQLQGDPEHPVTQGFLCHRTSRFLERQYSPDRLTHPLVRRDNDFQEASWDEALDLIAEKMLQFRDESGAASILHYRCGGSLGMMKHITDHFFERFGPVTIKSGDICSGAGEAAQATDFGHCDSNDMFDIANSRTIVLWGKNVYISSVHLIPLLKEAKRKGATIILIDPVHHQTTQLSDLFVQPRAGGDAALACGIARWLLENEHHDKDAEFYCDHFDRYRDLIQSQTLEEWAAAAGVSLESLQALATAYASGPSAILMGWGMQRRRYGATTVRAIDALAAFAGNIGIRGGGASFYFQRRTAFDFSFANPTSAPRTIPEPLLGPGILEQTDPPIRMVWVTAANPVAMLPASKTVAHALQSRELTVVVDAFMTDSARCADVILPTTTMLEEDDLLGAYGHHWLTAMEAVIDPPEQVKSDYQIVCELAPRLGLAEAFSGDVDFWRQRLLKKLSEQQVSLAQLKAKAIKNPFAKEVAFADRKFATSTGRINLIHELPSELSSPKSSSSLKLAALSTRDAQSSQWKEEEQEGPALATLHPSRATGYADGDLAWLSSDTGKIQVRLRFDPNQRPEIILMDKGGWHRKGRCANALIPAELTDDGECAVYYDTPVTLEPIAGRE